jgi:very-short-patch-repair endonuclease
MIEELLESARRTDRALEAFLREGKSEDFFVKNLENVQGDERDVIFVSVGYGPALAGQGIGSMSFGPVNSEGGVRRLNVLFTRAKQRCDVFVSFDPSEIVVDRSKHEGVRVLKRYLQFADTGVLDEPRPSGAGADSPFEEMVADQIRAQGFEVDHQVGSAGFRIDLAVRHRSKPGRYLLAVECDGATYHRALWARERDRHRQQILENLGWRFHRIWSTDWFYRRSDELQRLKAALENALGAETPPPASRVLVPDDEPEAHAAESPGMSEPVVVRTGKPSKPYVRWTGRVSQSCEPHEASPHVLDPLVTQIVETEGPIHQEEVARRVAAAFGKERSGSRIVEVTIRALKASGRRLGSTVREKEGFWFTMEQEASPPVRDRSEEALPLLKAEYLSPMEIAAALRNALNDSHRVSEEELIIVVARALGFKRTGPDIASAIRSVLRNLVSSGVVRSAEDMLQLTHR